MTAIYGDQNVDDYKLADLARINHAAQVVREKGKVGAVISDLTKRYVEGGETTKYGSGLVGALNEIESSEFLDKYGKEVQDHAVSSFARKIQIDDAQYKITSRPIKDDFSKKLIDGGLSKTEIKVSSLRPEDKEHYYGLVDAKQRADRQEARINAQENRILKAEEKARIAEAKNRVIIDTENYIRTGDIQDEKDIDKIVAAAGLTHEDNSRLKKMLDDSNVVKGQINYYDMAVEKIDKTFGFPKKEDRSEADTNKRSQYITTLGYYMKKAKLKTNDPAVIELIDKLLEKRTERTPG
jgi:hypothetical protein